jgi:hypothetical protein
VAVAAGGSERLEQPEAPWGSAPYLGSTGAATGDADGDTPRFADPETEGVNNKLGAPLHEKINLKEKTLKRAPTKKRRRR